MATTPNVSRATPMISNEVLELARRTLMRSYGARSTPTKVNILNIWKALGQLTFEKLLECADKYEATFDEGNLLTRRIGGQEVKDVIPGVQVPHLGELVWLRCNAPVGISQATPMSRQKKILKLQFIAERKFLSRANVAQPSSSLVSHGRSRPPSTKMSTFRIAKKCGLGKDLVNSVLQAIVESFATVVRKSIVKRNVQGSSMDDESEKKHVLMLYADVPIVLSVQSRKLVFHGKKASLFIRSKREQEKVSSKTLGYRASTTHSSTHNERLVYASSLKTHSIASTPLEDDLSIVDVDDDASSILSGSGAVSRSNLSSRSLDNDRPARKSVQTSRNVSSNLFAGGNDLLKSTWNNNDGSNIKMRSTVDGFGTRYNEEDRPRKTRTHHDNLRDTTRGKNRSKAFDLHEKFRGTNRSLAWTKKYAQVDQDATEATLKFLIELIATFQAVDRDDDGIVVSSDLRPVFHLSINDSNRVIRELRGRGNSGRGTISGITIEDFVWAFRHTSNFSDGSKIKVILNDMKAVIKRLSAVDDANPTSGRHLRDQIMMQVRPSESHHVYKLGIQYHVLKACIKILVPSISEKDVLSLLETCKASDNDSAALEGRLDYGKLWCKPSGTGLNDVLDETTGYEYDGLVSPIRTLTRNDTSRKSKRPLNRRGHDRNVEYNGSTSKKSYRERPVNRSFSKSMSKQRRRGNDRPSTSLINANNVEVKKAIIHFHDWLLSKRLTLTAAFRSFDKYTRRKISGKDFTIFFEENRNKFLTENDIEVLASFLFQERKYISPTDFISIMKLPDVPIEVDWEESILQEIRTWVMREHDDAYSAFKQILSHKRSSHINKNVLDADELRYCLEKEDFVISSVQADRLLRLIDSDNDKRVGLKDFQLCFGMQKSNDTIIKLQELLYAHHLTITELIGYLDRNQDGVVTFNEWVAGLKNLEPKMSSKLIREVGRTLCAQGSGRSIIDLELLRKRLQHTFASRDKMWKSNVLDRIRKAVSKSTGGDSIDEVLDRSLRTKNRRNPDLVTRAELTSTLRQLGCHLDMPGIDQLMMLASSNKKDENRYAAVGVMQLTSLFKKSSQTSSRELTSNLNWIMHTLRYIKIYQKKESLSDAALFRIYSEKHANHDSLISRSDFEKLLSNAGLPSKMFTPQDEHYEALFEIFDVDKDGFLSKSEFARCLEPNHFRCDKRVQRIILLHLGKAEMESMLKAFDESVGLRTRNAWDAGGRQGQRQTVDSSGLRLPYANWSLQSLKVEVFDRLYRRRHSPVDLFHALDGDKDGFLSLDDFVNFFHNERTSSGPSRARSMVAPIENCDSFLYVRPKLVKAMFALADVQKVGFIDKDEFERFSNTCMGFAVSSDKLIREIKKILESLRWRVEKCYCFLALAKSDGGTKTNSNGFREKSAGLTKFDPDSETVQRTIASISLDVNQFRRGLLALGIPYMSTEQVERLSHLIDSGGRGKVTFKDFAAKFRPGQLKFGWLEEALQIIGSSFVTKRRGGQVEQDAELELRRIFKEKFGRRLKVCPSASEFELWMLSKKLFGANISRVQKLNLNPKQWVELYNRADTKSDGILDEDEFVFTFLPFESHVMKLNRIREIAYELAPRGDHRGMFEEMDMNKDGMIDRKDFEATMRRVLVDKDDVMSDMWGVFSKDGRAISYEEFKRSIIEPVQAKLTLDFEAHAMKKIRELFRKKSDNLDLIFKTFDTDGDGELSPEELRRGLSHIGFSISGPELEQLVKAIDSNEDGQIQLSEFKFWLAPKSEETEKKEEVEIRRKKVIDLIISTYHSAAQAFYKFGGKKISHNIRFPILRLEDFVQGLQRLFKKHGLPSPSIEQAAHMFNAAGSVRGTLVQEKFVKYFGDWRAVSSPKKMLRTARRAEMKKSTTSRTSLW